MNTELSFEQSRAGAQHAAPLLPRTATSSRSAAGLIQTLKPNVSQSAALQKFSAFGPAALLRNLRIGPLQRIAEVYVPFHLYRVDYDLGREHQSRFFAIDT